MCNNETLEEQRLCILAASHHFLPLELFYGMLSVVCFIGGTLGNLVAFSYFLHQRKDNSTVIYILITAVDVLVSISQLPVGISYLQDRKPALFGSDLFCNVWHFMWQILSRQSVALVAILSITRTLSILFPLKLRISKRSIIFLLVATFLLQTFTGTIMYWFGGSGVYQPGNVDCSLLSINYTYYYYHVVPTMVWYWLPVLPVIASCFVSLYVLQASKRLQTQSGSRLEKGGSLNKAKDSATMTIVLLTSLYVIFNMPMCVLNIFWTIQDMAHDENDQLIYDFFRFDRPTYYVNNFVYCLCVPLNSLANPILYFCRIKRLREALVVKTMRLFASSSSGTHMQLHSLTHSKYNHHAKHPHTQLNHQPQHNQQAQHNLLAQPVNIRRATSHQRTVATQRVPSQNQPRNNSVDLGMMRRRSLEL